MAYVDFGEFGFQFHSFNLFNKFEHTVGCILACSLIINISSIFRFAFIFQPFEGLHCLEGHFCEHETRCTVYSNQTTQYFPRNVFRDFNSIANMA